MRLPHRLFTLSATLGLLAGLTTAQAAELKEITRASVPGSNFPISTTVSVPANAVFTYVSGNLADVANPDAPKGSYESYGDTYTQTISIIKKIEKLLEAQGMTLADIIKVNVFLAGDPKLDGKMDFGGLNKAYIQFFGNPDQPNKPVRTALQVAALPMPGGLVEIECVAAKVPAPAKAKAKK